MQVPIIGQALPQTRDPDVLKFDEAGQPHKAKLSSIVKGDRVGLPQPDGTVSPVQYAQENAQLMPYQGELVWGLKFGPTQPDAEPALAPTGDIKGQRQLSKLDVTLMNEIKDKGAEVAALIERLNATPGVDGRMLAIGTTYCQLGMQQLVRAVARPVSFC